MVVLARLKRVIFVGRSPFFPYYAIGFRTPRENNERFHRTKNLLASELGNRQPTKLQASTHGLWITPHPAATAK